MAEIKSALELALEKAERYGKASPQEMQEVKWQEQARHLAAEFLREKIELEPELKKLSCRSPDCPDQICERNPVAQY